MENKNTMSTGELNKYIKNLWTKVLVIVVATVIINIGATILTVRENSNEITKIKDKQDNFVHYKEFNMFMAHQQELIKLIRKGTDENKEEIREIESKIDNFIQEYKTKTRGSDLSMLNKNSDG